MLKQSRRDGRLRLDDTGEHLHPGLEHGVLGVPLVQVDGAVIGVDDGLDRVAHVVDLVARKDSLCAAIAGQRVRRRVFEGATLGVRVGVAGRVAIDNPDDLAVDNSRIRIAVNGQPRCDLVDPITRLAVIQDLRIRVDPARQYDVGLAELEGIQRLVEQAPDRHTALAVIGVLRGVRLRTLGRGATARNVDFDRCCTLGTTDDRIGR